MNTQPEPPSGTGHTPRWATSTSQSSWTAASTARSGMSSAGDDPTTSRTAGLADGFTDSRDRLTAAAQVTDKYSSSRDVSARLSAFLSGPDVAASRPGLVSAAVSGPGAASSADSEPPRLGHGPGPLLTAAAVGALRGGEPPGAHRSAAPAHSIRMSTAGAGGLGGHLAERRVARDSAVRPGPPPRASSLAGPAGPGSLTGHVSCRARSWGYGRSRGRAWWADAARWIRR
jgi:hypothetical protein